MCALSLAHLCIRECVLYLNAIVFLHGLEYLVRLGVEASRIQTAQISELREEILRAKYQ